MERLTVTQAAPLNRAIFIAREALVIATEIEDDLSVFFLDEALRSLQYTAALAAHEDHGTPVQIFTVIDGGAPQRVSARVRESDAR